jgi:major vault protein
MTDKIEVETSDHAKLYLKLAYSWFFKVDKSADKKNEHLRLFGIRDFTGDACKAMASRIRGRVSSVTFDDFHKHSTELIHGAIFKRDPESNDILPFIFPENNLYVTNVDIREIDPVDAETRTSLQKSVNLSFEIQTRS